jgi:hypothetical protein
MARIGSYQTPKFRSGDAVLCEVRGEVVMTGLSAAPIPWPIAKRPGGRARALVALAGLAADVGRGRLAADRRTARARSGDRPAITACLRAGAGSV